MVSRNDQDKLRLLLVHWAEHNREHAQEFRRWAERSGPAREDILAAAEELDSATRSLTQALEKLGGPL